MGISWLGNLAKKKVRLSTLGVILLGIFIVFIILFDYFYFADHPLPKVDIPYFTNQAGSPGFLAVIDHFEDSNLKSPTGVAVGRDGKIYVADSGNNRVLVYDHQGKPLLQFGVFGTLAGEMNYPYSIAVDTENRIYVGQFKAGRIQIFNARGKLISKIDKESAGVVVAPLAMALDEQGLLYAANQDGKILEFDQAGKLVRSFAGAGSDIGSLSHPKGIAVDDHAIYVSDTNNLRIQEFSKAGKVLTGASKEILQVGMPAGLCLSQGGDLFLVDTFSNRVNVYDQKLNLVSHFGQRGQGDGQLNFPVGIAVDDYGKVYVADTANNRISVFQR